MGELPSPSTGGAADRPTVVRWRMVALLFAFSFMTWFNRVSLTVAYDERIQEQYGIAEADIGMIYSTFLVVYALCMMPGGWFVDRFGARTALAVMGFGSAFFVAWTGLVGYLAATAGALLLALYIVRGLMGLFTAPVYPASGRTVLNWLPFTQRSRINGLITGAALLGNACTFVGFGKLLDWFDWPIAFVITGAITALFALLWAVYARNRPEEHPGVNAAEQAWIRQGDPVPERTPSVSRPAISTWALLRNRSLLMLTLSYSMVNYFEYLFFFWIHNYFKKELHLESHDSRLYATILNLSMGAGMFLGGLLSDRLLRSLGYRLGRAAVPVAGMLLGALLLGVGISTAEPRWVLLWLCLAVAAVGACEGPVWTTALELGGARAGMSGAIVNTGGNVGGFIAPALTPLVNNWFGRQWGIGLGGIACLIGVVLWIWIDPRDRIGEPTAS